MIAITIIPVVPYMVRESSSKGGKRRINHLCLKKYVLYDIRICKYHDAVVTTGYGWMEESSLLDFIHDAIFFWRCIVFLPPLGPWARETAPPP